MHPKTQEFQRFLEAYNDARDRHIVAVEFAVIFIESENAAQVMALLKTVSKHTFEAFIANVQSAPSTEDEWSRFQVFRPNQSERDATAEKLRWRQCVDAVRSVLDS
jgi:hypothetical protein